MFKVWHISPNIWMLHLVLHIYFLGTSKSVLEKYLSIYVIYIDYYVFFKLSRSVGRHRPSLCLIRTPMLASSLHLMRQDLHLKQMLHCRNLQRQTVNRLRNVTRRQAVTGKYHLQQ